MIGASNMCSVFHVDFGFADGEYFGEAIGFEEVLGDGFLTGLGGGFEVGGFLGGRGHFLVVIYLKISNKKHRIELRFYFLNTNIFIYSYVSQPYNN